VAYGDLQAAAWTVNNRCLGCHVQPQALIGGELSRSLTTHNDAQRNILFNLLSIHRQSNGALRDDHYPGYEKAQNLLGLWGLNAWHKKEDIRNTLHDAATYTRNTQDVDGGWSTDYVGGWWTPRASQTAFNLKNLVDVADLLERHPGLQRQVPQVLANGGALSSAYYLASSGGNVLVSNTGAGTVVAVAADGSSVPLASGLAKPQALQVGADGNVYVPTDTGIYRFPATGGTPERFSTLSGATDLFITPAGDMYATHYTANTVYRISSSGDASVFLSGAPLSGPAGLALDEQGRLLVLNYYGRSILRINADKTHETVVALTYGNPRSLVRHAGQWLVGTSNGLYRFNADWQGERITFVAAHGVAVNASGTIFTSDGGNTVLKLVAQPVDTPASVLAFDTAIAKGAQWLLADNNINGNSNLELAHRLIGLGSAYGRLGSGATATAVHNKMVETANALKARQRPDGGWGQSVGNGSDSMVTAQVGFALDYVHPSPDDPYILGAVQYLLSRQQADGSWASENGILTTRYGATSWVEIWLPVALERVGGIDTDLTLRFAPDTPMSNPSQAPSASAALADGSMQYTWKLLGVTTKERRIEFDVLMQDMRPGESRAVSSGAQLTFRNSFVGDAVTADIQVPVVRALAGMAVDIATDASSYPAQTPVLLAVRVHNTSAVPQSGSVALSIVAPDDTVVADLGSLPFAALASGATLPLPASWNTGTVLAGPYRAVARLDDANGHLVDRAEAAFAIVAGQGAALGAHVHTDKPVYPQGAQVQIVSRVTNLASNQAWTDLVARTSVLNGDGSVRWTASTPIVSLAPSGYRELTYSMPLASAPLGAYPVRLEVLDGQGAVLATASSSFSVTAAAANPLGVQGTLTPSASNPIVGQAIALNLTVTNTGGAPITSGTVRVRLLDPSGGAAVLATFVQSGVSLGVGATAHYSWNWNAAGHAGQVVPMAATIEHGGVEYPVAQGFVTLAGAPAHAIPLWNGWMSLLFAVLAWPLARRAARR